MKDKRLFCRAVACLTGVVILLNACSKPDASATDLMALLLSELAHPEMQLYFDGAAEEAEGWLSEDDAEELYSGHSPTSLSDQYAIALCKDDRIYEIHLYDALSTKAASQIEEFLRERLETLQRKENYLYDPESFAPSGVVWQKGRWVCLLVTEDNQSAKALLKKRI